MKLTSILLAGILSLTLPFCAVAHSGDNGESIVKALDLDEERADEVKEIMETYHEQRKEVRARAHDEMKKLKEQKKQKLEAVLTEDEMEQLEAIKDARKDKHKKGDKHHDKEWGEEDEL